jgi:hypothetical protein
MEDLQMELYKGDYYTVAHSVEEIKQLEDSGWSKEKPANHLYLPQSSEHVAVEQPVPESNPIAEAAIDDEAPRKKVKRGNAG